MYANGHGVARDDGEAVRWYAKAAEQGHALAQFNLGGMYNSGRGVARDAIRSYMWISLAAEAGDASASSDRKRIARRMSAVELGWAQDLKRQWLEAHRA